MGRIVFCYNRTGELSFTVNYTGCFIVNVYSGREWGTMETLATKKIEFLHQVLNSFLRLGV